MEEKKYKVLAIMDVNGITHMEMTIGGGGTNIWDKGKRTNK